MADNKTPKIKLPGILGKAVSMTASAIANKYTGKKIFDLFKQAENNKTQLGKAYQPLKKKLAIAKNKRKRNVNLEDADRISKSKTGNEVFQEPYLKNISVRKTGGKVKKYKTGGLISGGVPPKRNK